jgi:hypothetical protein
MCGAFNRFLRNLYNIFLAILLLMSIRNKKTQHHPEKNLFIEKACNDPTIVVVTWYNYC